MQEKEHIEPTIMMVFQNQASFFFVDRQFEASNAVDKTQERTQSHYHSQKATHHKRSFL